MKTKWIPVISDIQPPQFTDKFGLVLVVVHKKGEAPYWTTGYYADSFREWRVIGSLDDYTKHITHWSPVTLPKEGT